MVNWQADNNVVVKFCRTAEYPDNAPFHPANIMREIKNEPAFDVDLSNTVYEAVWSAMALSTRSSCHNPLCNLIIPGNSVVIKPNMIKECHEIIKTEWKQIITHAAILRPIIDAVLVALNGSGSICICDAPQTDSDFEKINENSGLNKLLEWYKNWAMPSIELVDLRQEYWKSIDGIVIDRIKLSGDPDGYSAINLADKSYFNSHKNLDNLYGADYDSKTTVKHHSNGIHEYLLSNTVLNADVLINVPKLKTHKKTGITAALKNMVGANGDKNWLPHYTKGTPSDNGDQFSESNYSKKLELRFVSIIKSVLIFLPKFMRSNFVFLKFLGKKIFGSTHATVRSGNWYGNDTAWRMVLDLNICINYWKNNGLQLNTDRKILNVVDAVIAGEGEGPLAPHAKKAAAIISGKNAVAVDAVCATLMGYDYKKIPMIKNAFNHNNTFNLCDFSVDTIKIAGDIELVGINNLKPFKCGTFVPHFGWKNYIENECF